MTRTKRCAPLLCLFLFALALVACGGADSDGDATPQTGVAPGAADAADAAVPAERHLTAIGLQLYTVRAEMEQDFEGTLRRLAAMGYSEVEFAGLFGHDPVQ